MESADYRDEFEAQELISTLENELTTIFDAMSRMQSVLLCVAQKNSDDYQRKLREYEKENDFQYTKPFPCVRGEPSDPSKQVRVYWRVANYVPKKYRSTTPPEGRTATTFAFKDIPSPKGKYGIRSFESPKAYKAKYVLDIALSAEEVFHPLREALSKNKAIVRLLNNQVARYKSLFELVEKID